MLSWTNDQLLLWLKNSEYSDDVVDAFRSHNITGLTLPFLNTEELKEMGIPSLHIRLRLMRDVGALLTEKNSSFLSSDNTHPIMTQLQSTMLATTLINTISHDIRDEVITNSEASNKSLVHQFGKLREDLLPILREIKDKKPLPTPGAAPGGNAAPVQVRSRTSPPLRKSVSSWGSVSPDLSERSRSRRSSATEYGRSSTTEYGRSRRDSAGSTAGTLGTMSSIPSMIGTADIMTASQVVAVKAKPALVVSSETGKQQRVQTNVPLPRSKSKSKRHGGHRGSANEPLKQLRARTEDKCYKILQSAMKSHGLDVSGWKKYALVIMYGGDQERVLSYDEKPVVVFKELTELGLNPSMMLRQVDEGDGLNDPGFDTPGGRL